MTVMMMMMMCKKNDFGADIGALLCVVIGLRNARGIVSLEDWVGMGCRKPGTM